MKIYTSYFGNLKNVKEAGIYPISICCIPPKWFDGPNLIAIAPTKSILFNCKNDHKLYEQRYRNEVLSIFKDPYVLIDHLNAISEGKDVALCCYEVPTDFCHRHILAAWITEQTGIEVQEFEKPGTYKTDPLF